MYSGPPRSSRFCSPWRKADFVSAIQSDHLPFSLHASSFAPAVAKASTKASESREGVRLSRLI